jgi:hypothetical protein
MVHNYEYKRKNRQSWAQENMQRALEKVMNRFVIQKTAANQRSAEAHFDKMGVLGSIVRKTPKNVSNARKERKSSGKKNIVEDTSDKSEVEGSDSRSIYYNEKYSRDEAI